MPYILIRSAEVLFMVMSH